MIEKAVPNYTSVPDAYSLDFGVTEEGTTLLISVNKNIVDGCYGLSSEEYAKFLATQWGVLTKKQIY